METIKSLIGQAKEFLNYTLFTTKGNDITLWAVLVTLFFIIIFVLVVNRLARLLEYTILPKKNIEKGMASAIANLFRYSVISIGSIIIISTSGIDISVLTVLFGTLGVGIGFGLQNVFSNFVSGIIILIESPIKVGDRIEIGNTTGDVIRISTRATTILTNDNINIIVPNSDFINKEVINWSYNDKSIRFKIPVGVDYSSDVRKVENILLEIAQSNTDVLKDPEPVVRFINFGDSAINFELRIWTTTLIHRQGKIISDLNFAIFESFKKANITIPFPQRDVRIINTKT